MALRRAQARFALQGYRDLETRRFEAGSRGRRTSGWFAPDSSANSEVGPALSILRARSRDLVRNNAFAKSAVEVIESETIGTGIVPQIQALDGSRSKSVLKIMSVWEAWAGSTDCDADGVHDFFGIQALIMRGIAEAGEILVRRRWRLDSDLPIPMQLQVLEADHLDACKNEILENGNRVIQGVEFDANGRRVAYWLFPEHPGEHSIILRTSWVSQRIEARDLLHLYRVDRAGQVRGICWGASVLLRLKDFDEYEDAQLVRQKIAACFTAFVQDMEAPSDPKKLKEGFSDQLEPGAIEILPPGKTVTLANPPAVSGYREYASVSLHAIAAGFSVPYEALTGDLSEVNYSSGRMGRLKFQRLVDKWRWHLVIPRFCVPAFRWFLEAAELKGFRVQGLKASWTPPRREMLDPTREVPAVVTSIRAGLSTLSEAIRENGYDPKDHLEEWARDAKTLDDLGLMFDSDPRKVMRAGIAQSYVGSSDGADKPEPPKETASEESPA